MGEYINFEQDDKDWYDNNTNKDIPVGVHHAPDWLKMDGTSAHNLIEPNGDVIRCRSTKKRAWHAKGFNTDSIGIEILVTGKWKYGSFLEEIKQPWATKAQYDSLVELSAKTIDYWKIPIDKVVRHSDISPGRKHDPGDGFRWSEFIGRLREAVEDLKNQ
jgi:AmpD protein